MKIVGLTGGIGSGKTTVANFFSEFKNVAIYIADKEAKKLMNSSIVIRKKLLQEFGENAYLDNQLNKKFISEIVFNNQKKLSVLNAIVHPEVRKHFNNFVKQNSDKAYIIYENAILFESKSNQFCDIIITVQSSLNTRIERAILRDNVSRKEILDRIKNQWLEDKKTLQSNYVILNEELMNTRIQVKKIHNILTKKE
ncbi:dephospho-CoA kinase [Polaribacter sp. MSW13]|uniref:Dephospho-CoA kinase n=1 Tax=Polaribacter marinus TaxID=2916838 RepID=A0A9X1VKW9_9FLAO|nr:dephospho-CoA kinase [Polaribacter marinus]MCI2227898.1 dephospho-CoA kinase [Polaribacter marinus]